MLGPLECFYTLKANSALDQEPSTQVFKTGHDALMEQFWQRQSHLKFCKGYSVGWKYMQPPVYTQVTVRGLGTMGPVSLVLCIAGAIELLVTYQQLAIRLQLSLSCKENVLI